MCEIWEEVRQEGIERGMAEGKTEGMVEAIRSLMNLKGWSVEDALDALSIPKIEWEKYKAAVQG